MLLTDKEDIKYCALLALEKMRRGDLEGAARLVRGIGDRHGEMTQAVSGALLAAVAGRPLGTWGI